MAEARHKFDVIFFKTEQGNEPVREWLQSLPKGAGSDVLKVQYCWPIGKPLVGSLGNGLWEVRSRLGDRIARVIFYVEDTAIVLLNAFIKKSQKTPKHELDLAAKRRNQLR